MPKPFHHRVKHGPTADQLQAELQKELSKIPDATIVVIAPPPVRGLGTAGGLKFLVQDRAGYGYKELQAATDNLIAACNKDASLSNVFTTYRATAPQLYANVDRVKASMLNVPIGNIFEALQINLGSAYVNDLNLFGRTFQVRVQSEGEYRRTAEDIPLFKVRSQDNHMVPLGSVVDVEWRSGPDRVVRYNMYPSAEVQGDTALGHSSGESMAAVERIAAETLPAGMQIAWTDIAYQQQLAGNTSIFIFPLCVLFVFLVHSAEYESWLLPLAIILIAPLCLPFALWGVVARGMDNNLITQIGFIVLVGLAAKNAVLIVEFAKQLQEEGHDRFEAAAQACRLRLRPILMTSFAFILGVLPMAQAVGPGAEIRQVLGTAVLNRHVRGDAVRTVSYANVFCIAQSWVEELTSIGDVLLKLTDGCRFAAPVLCILSHLPRRSWGRSQTKPVCFGNGAPSRSIASARFDLPQTKFGGGDTRDVLGS